MTSPFLAGVCWKWIPIFSQQTVSAGPPPTASPSMLPAINFPHHKIIYLFWITFSTMLSLKNMNYLGKWEHILPFTVDIAPRQVLLMLMFPNSFALDHFPEVVKIFWADRTRRKSELIGDTALVWMWFGYTLLGISNVDWISTAWHSIWVCAKPQSAFSPAFPEKKDWIRVLLNVHVSICAASSWSRNDGSVPAYQILKSYFFNRKEIGKIVSNEPWFKCFGMFPRVSADAMDLFFRNMVISLHWVSIINWFLVAGSSPSTLPSVFYPFFAGPVEDFFQPLLHVKEL